MTKFWDDAERAARVSFEQAIQVERNIREKVFLIMGDREFPDKFREQIWDATIEYALETVGVKDNKCQTVYNDKAIHWYEQMGSSRYLSSLHDLWHRIARERIRTRFGYIMDDPAGALRCRDMWDADPDHKELWRQLEEEQL